LPALWGPNPLDNTLFACGDPNNPGAVYWTAPNDPDRTSDANIVVITSGSEPMVNGCVWDDISFAFSSDNLYQMARNGAGWVGLKTPCGKGLWTRQALAVSPKGIYFVTKDGIALTGGGGSAVMITDKDLAPIFPHDGIPGVAVNGFNPPDYTQPNRMRLSYVNGYLYFDYLDTGANSRTLVFRESDASWWPDAYTPGVTARLSDPGPVYEELIGGSDGLVYLPGGATDNGTGISCQARALFDQGDIRRQKLYRDGMLDADLTGSTLTVTLTGNNGASALGSQVITGSAGRLQYITDIVPAQGALARNLQMDLTWTPAAATAPILYAFDVPFQVQPELASNWLSGMTTHGVGGYQTAAFAYIAYLATAACTFTVIVDGVTYSYTLPSTGGAYAKTFLWLQTVKGLTFQYGLQSTAPCLLFDEDTEIGITLFGRGGYERVRPFAMGKAA
jgi:hypothetical protein